MSTYYSGNAIVAMVRAKNMQPPFYVSEDRSWDLVYGDSEARPLLLVTAKGMTTAQFISRATILALENMPLRKVATLSRIHHLALCFDEQAQTITQVRVLAPTLGIDTWTDLSLASLSQLFARAGLPVSKGVTDKAINSESSSAFHDWQRCSLGAGIVVSDCDLWLLRDGQIAAVLELKRSFYDFDRWLPFEKDYSNFRLLFNLLNPLSIPLFVAYNRRTKNPFNDDPSQILMFLMTFNTNPPYRRLGILSQTDFLAGRFLTM